MNTEDVAEAIRQSTGAEVRVYGDVISIYPAPRPCSTSTLSTPALPSSADPLDDLLIAELALRAARARVDSMQATIVARDLAARMHEVAGLLERFDANDFTNRFRQHVRKLDNLDRAAKSAELRDRKVRAKRATPEHGERKARRKRARAARRRNRA